MCSFLCLVLWAILLVIGLFVLSAVILWCETFQTKGSKASAAAAPQAAGPPRAVSLPPVEVARPFADAARSAAGVAPPPAVHLDPVEVARPFANDNDDRDNS